MDQRPDLSNEERDILHDVGFEDLSERAATAVLVDGTVRLAQSNDPGVEVMPLAEALRTYDFVQDLMFGLVEPDANEDIALIAEQRDGPLGHFVWVKPGAQVTLPVQTFTLLETPQGRQFTHDIMVIDEGASVDMISGSAVPSSVHKGRHVSIGECYMRKGASCNSVTIEHWGDGMDVVSYGYAQMDEGARSQSTAIKMAPVANDLSRSKVTMGANTNAVSQAIIFAAPGTERVIETETHLNGTGAKSEDLARMVSAGGTIINNAYLIGNMAGTNGFLGCDGLKLTDDGAIRAVPALEAKAEGAMLSHEASVGMIDSDKLNYLMAAGIEEDAARDLIVQGFLSLENTTIPAGLRRRVIEMIARAKSGGM
ncbi:SufD family Fe-S cluster assembly protein [Cognatiyoonia sp. IB215182]|uniref:SufD family Fe-S cluster assembly protein n=1 Tax=Cognatiyoonia sp. IB215182 TaxID=3097353 RepID=UPI002A151E0C|nr:SufD family Fe-S cluster assembly protein [Cognatiyoonia sp. IB215182]MDX8354754.1 SufD family Fe-S cluster assembly protein [Cognatiyoonia sp. IB215182]